MKKKLEIGDTVSLNGDLAEIVATSYSKKEGRFEVRVFEPQAKSYRKRGDRGLFIDMSEDLAASPTAT